MSGSEMIDTDNIITTSPDKGGPVIINSKIDILQMGENDTTSSVIISWETNKPATTQVKYGVGILSTEYSNESIEDANLSISHTVIIKGLKPALSYHYIMVSKDQKQISTESQDYGFVTSTKEKSIAQFIKKSLEETFSWTQKLNVFYTNIGEKIIGK